MHEDHHAGGAEPRRKQWGRPRAEQPRNRTIKIRVTSNEAVSIKAAAEAARMPVAIFLRRKGLNQSAAPVPVADIEVAAQLGRIGHNLNQMVKLAHDGRVPAWPAADIDALRDQLNAVAVTLSGRCR